MIHSAANVQTRTMIMHSPKNRADGGSDSNCSSGSNVGNDSNGVSDSDNGSVSGSNGNGSDGCDSDANCSSSRRLRQRFAFPVQASVK